MKTHELATLLQRLADALAPSLKGDASKALTDLAGLLKTYPDQPVTSFGAFLNDALMKDRNNPAALVERIRQTTAGVGENREDLWKSIEKLKATDLALVLKGLGQPAGKAKADRIESLRRLLGSKSVHFRIDQAGGTVRWA